MLFDFGAYISDMRTKPEKRDIIEKFEKFYGPISSNIKEQIWYVDYVSKFLPYYEAVNCPPELEEDFDWQLLFSLIVSSFSSEFELIKVNKIIPESNSKVDMLITVYSNNQSIVKKLNELWSFQLLRLFEIYIEEQIILQNLIAEDENELKAIYKSRLEKLDRIQNYNLEFIKLKNRIKKKSNLIYHYTSFETIFNIVKGKNLRACDLRKLNDKKEQKIWFDIFNQVYENIRNKEDSENYLGIIENIKKRVLQYQKLDYYVTCFTNERDLLSQWRAYGDDGQGVCIGFDMSMLLDNLSKNNDPNEEFKLLQGYLEYDYSIVYIDIYKKYYQLIQDFIQSSLNIDEYLNRIDKNEFLESECHKIFMRLQDLKDSAFFEEKEYRLFWIQEFENPIKTVKEFYRNRRYIPFVELEFGTDLIPIKEVIIGPAINDTEDAIEDITDALKYNGYDLSEIEISKSKIPYRK